MWNEARKSKSCKARLIKSAMAYYNIAIINY